MAPEVMVRPVGEVALLVETVLVTDAWSSTVLNLHPRSL